MCLRGPVERGRAEEKDEEAGGGRGGGMMRDKEEHEEEESEEKEDEFDGARSHSTSGEPCAGGGGRG